VRRYFVFLVLLGIKGLSRVFYRFDARFVGEVPEDPWRGIRLIAFLNHTSLYEPLFAGAVPNRFLWSLANHGMAPAAEKTLRRPVVGLLYKLLLHEVAPISRERDASWDAVLRGIRPDSVVFIAPEGRMMRAGGLDANGQPMTVRGGIADILGAIPCGRMLLIYSGGLHHVQVPGQLLPRLFKTLRIRLECLDLPEYRRRLVEGREPNELKRAVVADLERRRDLYCPFYPVPRPEGRGAP
jgi:hypothetical protein